jgi:hypothetical protein
MTQQDDQPNFFDLTDGQVRITYDVKAFDGKPHLTFQATQEDEDSTFVGNDISSQDSLLGLLLTVLLRPSIDAGETTLTLLLPDIKLRGSASQSYETLAIMTSSLGILPHEGADLMYKVLNLQGTASLVLPLVNTTG